MGDIFGCQRDTTVVSEYFFFHRTPIIEPDILVHRQGLRKNQRYTLLCKEPLLCYTYFLKPIFAYIFELRVPFCNNEKSLLLNPRIKYMYIWYTRTARRTEKYFLNPYMCIMVRISQIYLNNKICEHFGLFDKLLYIIFIFYC